jgi:hypothetical protein
MKTLPKHGLKLPTMPLFSYGAIPHPLIVRAQQRRCTHTREALFFDEQAICTAQQRIFVKYKFYAKVENS